MNLEFYIKLREMVTGGLVKMANTAKRTTAKIKGSNDGIIQSYDSIKRKIVELESTISRSSSIKHIRESRVELEKLQRLAARSPGNTQRGGGLLAGGLRSVLPALGVAGALTFGGTAFSTAMQQDSIGRAINFATGGQGESAIGSVKAINDKYGLSNEAGIEGFKTLAGSVRSLNIPLSETLRIYESVGAASGAMGVDAESQKGIFLALGQIASKGTVSAEELRGQIGERLPGAFGIAAKAMGMTEQELGKMMQRGELLSKDFLPKFATELQKTFGNAAVQSAEGPMAVYNRFKNVLHELTITVGQQLLPPMISLMNTFMSTVTWVKENWNWLGMLVTVVGSAVVAYQAVIVVTQLWAAAQTMLNLAMSMNPIGLVIAGIAALVAGIIYAWNHFEGFRKVVLGLWESFKQVFMNIGGFFKQVFAPIFEAINAFKEGRYIDAAKAVGKMAYNLTPIGLVHNAIQYQQQGGFTKGVADAWKKGVAMGANKKQTASESGSTTPQSATVGGAIPSSGGIGTNETVKGITGGGPRVININGIKFAEKIEIHATTFEKGMDSVKDKLDEYLLRILNSGAGL
jgi:tape measure domain-containing protein